MDPTIVGVKNKTEYLREDTGKCLMRRFATQSYNEGGRGRPSLRFALRETSINERWQKRGKSVEH